ncbi:DUF1304 domain-containing protein [Enterococcus sp. LJL51]|uniref:DUF1304 domain-containing protein n=1 Tax=Enterococcus sp. LJL51 TaxID=3416656 RepID=UPI003CF9D549
MSLISMLLVGLVAVEHLYIFYLETLATTSAKTAQTFNVKTEQLRDTTINTLLKNQGVYNGMLALGLLYSIFFSSNPLEMAAVFLIIIITVAIYGGLTSSKSIIIKQGGPAILALFSILLLK